jgi:hypothetical protein
MRLAILVLLAGVAQAQTQPPALLKNARIALRLDTGRVLIVGGSIVLKEKAESLYSQSMETLPETPGYSPLQPIEKIMRVSPDYMRRFKTDPETIWKAGDRWTIYTGAGVPLPAVIESISFGYYCGGISGYATAVARFEDPRVVNIVAGLRSGEYLAAPAPGLPSVSVQPLTPVNIQHDSAAINVAEKALLELGRKIVGDEDWQAEGSDEVRRMNRAWLTSDLRHSVRVLQWRLTGRTPLLLMESVWTDNGKPVFAGNGVIEEGSPLAILAFEPGPAKMMRVPEIMFDGWQRSEAGAFLNAWSVGKRLFVLLHSVGYEGFSVELMEIVPGKGFVPTGIAFGAGC